MDSNLTNLGYVEETVFGTTPSANLQLFRRTGGNIVPTQPSVVSQEIRSDLRAGRPVRVGQMASGTINMEWSYGTLDDILEGMLLEAWDSTVLVDGTTKKSYTFEEQFVDPDISPSQYKIYKGCRISQLSMSLGIGAIVTGSFGIMGATPSIAQASSGTGNTNPTTTGPWNTVDMVTSLLEGVAGGSPVALGKTTGVELNLSRNLREKREIGSLNPFDIGVGRLLVSGSIQQYFEDDVLMDAWFAFEDRELTVVLTDEDSNVFTIEIPKLKLVGDANIDNPGTDSDRIVTVNFEAYANAGDAALIRFTNST